MHAEPVPHEELAATLRALVPVRSLSPSSLVHRPQFWRRCELVKPHWWYDTSHFIFVDGIVGASKWNACRTYEQSTNGNLCIWLGFAFTGGIWREHCWCMLGDRVVETEWPHDNYYGAELSAAEHETLRVRCTKSDLSTRENARLWTVDAKGERIIIPYDPTIHARCIGRERDRLTNEIKADLG